MSIIFNMIILEIFLIFITIQTKPKIKMNKMLINLQPKAMMVSTDGSDNSKEAFYVF